MNASFIVANVGLICKFGRLQLLRTILHGRMPTFTDVLLLPDGYLYHDENVQKNETKDMSILAHTKRNVNQFTYAIVLSCLFSICSMS